MPKEMFIVRPYRDNRDLEAMIDLISKREEARLLDFPAVLDIQEIAGTPDGKQSFSLFRDEEGQLAGFSICEEESVIFEISPAVEFQGLADEIFRRRIQELKGTIDEIETSCREEDSLRRNYLVSRDFIEKPVRTFHFQRNLLEDIPSPLLPEGFVLRSVLGDQEAEQLLEIVQAAHGDTDLTLDYRLAMMHTPDYEQEMDLVAVAPDGTLAANVVCYLSQVDERTKIGFTDPVNTHPKFQQMGLAKALILEGFSRLKRSGVEIAQVSTWGENSGMIKTAESVGYRVFSTTIFYHKKISI